MSLAETVYTARFRSTETLERGRTQTISCPTSRAGATATPVFYRLGVPCALGRNRHHAVKRPVLAAEAREPELQHGKLERSLARALIETKKGWPPKMSELTRNNGGALESLEEGRK
jgi:hypothetical protein